SEAEQKVQASERGDRQRQQQRHHLALGTPATVGCRSAGGECHGASCACRRSLRSSLGATRENGSMPHTLAPGPDVVVETEIKHSRFLAALRRVETTEDALSFVEEQRRLYPDARHHCWACVVGADNADRAERSSDAGDPGGTAGVPMLQVLHHRDLVDVAVVVTRWFGGIKLGAGGLVR